MNIWKNAQEPAGYSRKTGSQGVKISVSGTVYLVKYKTDKYGKRSLVIYDYYDLFSQRGWEEWEKEMLEEAQEVENES